MDIDEALSIVERSINGEAYYRDKLIEAYAVVINEVKRGFRFTLVKRTTGKLRGLTDEEKQARNE